MSARFSQQLVRQIDFLALSQFGELGCEFGRHEPQLAGIRFDFKRRAAGKLLPSVSP